MKDKIYFEFYWIPFIIIFSEYSVDEHFGVKNKHKCWQTCSDSTPPSNPVPVPNGIIGMRCLWQILTTWLTSWTDCGQTTAAGKWPLKCQFGSDKCILMHGFLKTVARNRKKHTWKWHTIHWTYRGKNELFLSKEMQNEKLNFTNVFIWWSTNIAQEVNTNRHTRYYGIRQ